MLVLCSVDAHATKRKLPLLDSPCGNVGYVLFNPRFQCYVKHGEYKKCDQSPYPQNYPCISGGAHDPDTFDKDGSENDKVDKFGHERRMPEVGEVVRMYTCVWNTNRMYYFGHMTFFCDLDYAIKDVRKWLSNINPNNNRTCYGYEHANMYISEEESPYLTAFEITYPECTKHHKKDHMTTCCSKKKERAGKCLRCNGKNYPLLKILEYIETEEGFLFTKVEYIEE